MEEIRPTSWDVENACKLWGFLGALKLIRQISYISYQQRRHLIPFGKKGGLDQTFPTNTNHIAHGISMYGKYTDIPVPWMVWVFTIQWTALSQDADLKKLIPKFVMQLMPMTRSFFTSLGVVHLIHMPWHLRQNSGQSCNALSRMLVPTSRLHLSIFELRFLVWDIHIQSGSTTIHNIFFFNNYQQAFFCYSKISNQKAPEHISTLPKTNIAPENGWFPFGMAYFQGPC